MKENCLICLLKPPTFFTSLTCEFIVMNCQHSSNPSPKPYIYGSMKKRIFGLFLEIIAISSIVMEMYVIVSDQLFKDVLNIVLTMEILFKSIIMRKILWNNHDWRQRVLESKNLLRISEYIRKFEVLDHKYYRIIFGTSLVGIVVLICSQVILLVLIENLSEWDVLLRSLGRIVVGVLEALFYLKSWIDFNVYGIFFEQISRQIDKEITSRLRRPEPFYTSVSTCSDSFSRKIQKLRRLYYFTLKSFCKTVERIKEPLRAQFVLCYLTLIFLIFVMIVWLKGDIELYKDYHLIFLRFVMMSAVVVVFTYQCENNQSKVESVLDALFKARLNKLEKNEAKEVELCCKLFGWEQPMGNSMVLFSFNVSFLSKVMVDITINCMVVTQLYYWIEEQKT